MVAGIVLLALGLKKTLGHVDEPLKLVPAVAMLGGTAVYLLAHVAFRWRNVHRFSWQRLLCAVVLCALIPLATEVDALVTLALVLGPARRADRLRDDALRASCATGCATSSRAIRARARRGSSSGARSRPR